MATIPVDIRTAPLGDALAAIYDAVLATLPRLNNLETLMAELGPALDRLDTSISAAVTALTSSDVPALQAALDAERAQTALLIQQALDTTAAEDAEDVSQNASLADAVAARDALVSETDAAVVRISSSADALDSALTPAEPTPDEPPVEPV